MNTPGDTPAEKRETLLKQVKTAVRPEDDALLMVARFVPLRALERLALLLSAPSVLELSAMDHYQVERCVGRPLRATRWDPKQLLEDVRIDNHWLSLGERYCWWINDAEYPAHLRRIWDPPAVLYGWGATEGLADPGIALVGTRRPDNPGKTAAYRLGLALGEHGVVVNSGLARGIDSCAHRGAVASGTPAVAVLGSGVDTVYPRENRGLAADVLDAGGMIVSEYPPGTAPHRWRFPARNRIVVGLSAGVVVVQAPERSGALISADFGLQNGMPVMVHRAGADWTGGKHLVVDGSPVVEDAADVLSVVAPGTGTVSGSSTGDDRVSPPARSAIEVEQEKLALFEPIRGGDDDAR